MSTVCESPGANLVRKISVCLEHVSRILIHNEAIREFIAIDEYRTERAKSGNQTSPEIESE